ncbi:MAG: hypothetical protein Q4G05_00805 [Clostridia bacterium]|nr:hypothetical protein [Clostridia bacterium]
MQKKRISINLMLLIFIFIIILLSMYFIIKINVERENKHQIEGAEQETTNDSNTNTDTDTNINIDQPKNSSKMETLKVGEWGIASKLESNDYKSVNVRVSNIQRGTSAERIIKSWSESNSDRFIFTEALNKMEWVLIEYEIDLSNIKMSEKGNTVGLALNIEGLGNNTSIKYDNKIYNITVFDLNKDEYINDKIATGRYSMQLPKGCTDYTIILGDNTSQRAFIKGE